MSVIERLGLPLLRGLDPELAHGLSLKILNLGLPPLPGPIASPRLRTTLCGMDLRNPVGLAAGFDKNATAIDRLARAGFGFLEVGAATPRPQPGNPKPRLFRLSEDHAAINRFGFNNDGMEAISDRLRQATSHIPVGLNLGANKDSADRAEDFARVLSHAGPHIDFATVNVSSPNTEALRDLQGPAALKALLDGVMAARAELDKNIPVFLKIAPDLGEAEIDQIAQTAQDCAIDAIVATNTTVSRDGLSDSQAHEAGGLSGAPLFDRSTRVLARLSMLTDLPLIGVGGVASPEQAYAKIRAGASAVQLYTGMVYGGLSLAAEIAQGLDALLLKDGFRSVAEAVGTDRDHWL